MKGWTLDKGGCGVCFRSYDDKDVEGVIENLLDIIDAVRSIRELHPAQEGIITKVQKWLNTK